jgi:nucleoside-diphosphate-sugar epimerase
MILVTGATGLVGSHLVLRLLQNNQPVSAIYRTNHSIRKTKEVFALYGHEALFDRIDWIEADITDVPSLEFAFRNIEYVYHCAACISFDPDDEELLRKVNIEGTANVVNFCLQYGVRKLCHVSSIAALGDLKPGEEMITEETEWNPEKPHSDYAISKYGAEMEIWRGQQEGLEVVIVNPGVVLGPLFWKSGSGKIFTRVARGLLFYTKGTTGFTTVDDVVAIMIKLMESDIQGERFIIISKNISFENMMAVMAKALRVKPPFIYGKPWMTSLAWRLDWLLSLFGKKRTLSRSMAGALHSTEQFSSERVGFALYHTFVNLEEYLQKIADFYPKK